jgi:hypothetical protein
MNPADVEAIARALHRQHRRHLALRGYRVPETYDACDARTQSALRALVLRAEAFAL